MKTLSDHEKTVVRGWKNPVRQNKHYSSARQAAGGKSPATEHSKQPPEVSSVHLNHPRPGADRATAQFTASSELHATAAISNSKLPILPPLRYTWLAVFPYPLFLYCEVA